MVVLGAVAVAVVVAVVGLVAGVDAGPFPFAEFGVSLLPAFGGGFPVGLGAGAVAGAPVL